MSIIKEYKIFNGEIITECKIHNKWKNDCTRFLLYDKNDKFIRYMTKREVENYMNPDRVLERKFAEERRNIND